MSNADNHETGEDGTTTSKSQSPSLFASMMKRSGSGSELDGVQQGDSGAGTSHAGHGSALQEEIAEAQENAATSHKMELPERNPHQLSRSTSTNKRRGSGPSASQDSAVISASLAVPESLSTANNAASGNTRASLGSSRGNSPPRNRRSGQIQPRGRMGSNMNVSLRKRSALRPVKAENLYLHGNDGTLPWWELLAFKQPTTPENNFATILVGSLFLPLGISIVGLLALIPAALLLVGIIIVASLYLGLLGWIAVPVYVVVKEPVINDGFTGVVQKDLLRRLVSTIMRPTDIRNKALACLVNPLLSLVLTVLTVVSVLVMVALVPLFFLGFAGPYINLVLLIVTGNEVLASASAGLLGETTQVVGPFVIYVIYMVFACVVDPLASPTVKDIFAGPFRKCCAGDIEANLTQLSNEAYFESNRTLESLRERLNSRKAADLLWVVHPKAKRDREVTGAEYLNEVGVFLQVDKSHLKAINKMTGLLGGGNAADGPINLDMITESSQVYRGLDYDRASFAIGWNTLGWFALAALAAVPVMVQAVAGRLVSNFATMLPVTGTPLVASFIYYCMSILSLFSYFMLFAFLLVDAMADLDMSRKQVGNVERTMTRRNYLDLHVPLLTRTNAHVWFRIRAFLELYLRHKHKRDQVTLNSAAAVLFLLGATMIIRLVVQETGVDTMFFFTLLALIVVFVAFAHSVDSMCRINKSFARQDAHLRSVVFHLESTPLDERYDESEQTMQVLLQAANYFQARVSTLSIFAMPVDGTFRARIYALFFFSLMAALAKQFALDSTAATILG